MENKIRVYGSVYKTKSDSFENLMKMKCFGKTLFIFNDNEREHNTNKKGAGNAVMRQYNIHSMSEALPNSHGIPTGLFRSGYTELNNSSRKAIDTSIREIKDLLESNCYDSIMYSLKTEGELEIGTSIFNVAEEVIEYISMELLKLGSEYCEVKDGGQFSEEDVFDINI